MSIPGYIDLQVNGLKGVDYSAEDLCVESFVASCEGLQAEGTTGFLPTVVTCREETAYNNLKTMSSALKYDLPRSMVIGFHLEGPFISGEDGARGVHDKRFVQPPGHAWLDKMQEACGGMVKMVTIASELPGADGFIRSASRQGVIVSLGHQLADAAQIRAAADAGALSLTHLGNGLPRMIHRFDNPLWPSLADDRLAAMIIPDGHHLTPDMIKVFLRAKGIDRLVAVSDASPLALMPPGVYEAFGRKMEVANERIFDPQTGYLAGSWSTLRQCVQFMKSLDFLDDNSIELMVHHNPLKLLNIQ